METAMGAITGQNRLLAIAMVQKLQSSRSTSKNAIEHSSLCFFNRNWNRLQLEVSTLMDLIVP